MTLYLDAQSKEYASAICYGLFDSCKDTLKQGGYKTISLPEFFDIMTDPETHFVDPNFELASFAPYREFSMPVARNLHAKNKKIPLIAQNSYFTREGFIFMPEINPQIFLINDTSLFTYKKNYQEEELQIDKEYLRETQPTLKLEGGLIFSIKEIDPTIRKCIFGEKQGIEEVLEQWGIDTIEFSVCDAKYINAIERPFLRQNLFSRILDNTILFKATADIPNWARGIKKITKSSVL